MASRRARAFVVDFLLAVLVKGGASANRGRVKFKNVSLSSLVSRAVEDMDGNKSKKKKLSLFCPKFAWLYYSGQSSLLF